MSCRRMALWAALLSVLPSLALAQCTTKADSSALTKSVKLAANCNQRRLQQRSGGDLQDGAHRRAPARSSTTRSRSPGARTTRTRPRSTAAR